VCGIAGHIRSSGRADPLDTATLHHRGPDGSGDWTSPDRHVWLGATRLAILDLSENGAQPMHDPETGNVIVFNGEIYNHLELREQLRHVPYSWRGTSDTETLLVAYRAWGQEMAQRLKGMFAFAVYDARDKSLFLARGRLGIKPLYYSIENGSIRFASEVRTLLKDSPSSVAPETVSAYLQWGACPEEYLLTPKVREFPAGHYMRISHDGRFVMRRYWPLYSSLQRVNEDIHNGSVVSELRKLLERVVEEHLISDVPVATFLSGGIDSSVITAIAAQKMSGKLYTFTVGFDEESLDESRIADVVARRYNTIHERIEVPEEEVIEIVKEAVTKMDLPSVDAINTYIVSKKVAERGIKVALSGLGGDELFGGYPSFRDVRKLKLLLLLPKRIRIALGLFGSLGKRIADLPNKCDATILAHWRRRFWTDEMLREANLPVVPFFLRDEVWLPDDFARISWAELTGYMRHMLLRDSDQMSMAVSLELRVPYLDNELVDYVVSLPQSLKRAWPRTVDRSRWADSKPLLVEACRDLLPRSVYDRRKMGFTLPMDGWIQGPLASFAAEGLALLADDNIVPRDTLKNIQEGFRRRKIHWTRFWSLVVLGWYLKHNAHLVELTEQ
jgi:asparagine synthase (glutamine-hydrolysing)